MLIDLEGRVRNARAVNGHPLLQAAAVQAARRWRFVPFNITGRAVRLGGVLSIFFSPDAEEMKSQCDGLKLAL